MPHLPDDAEIGDYVAKGAIFVLVCFGLFCVLVIVPALLLG